MFPTKPQRPASPPASARAFTRKTQVILTSFSELSLAKPLLQALAEEGYREPTPIQLQAIPGVLAGRVRRARLAGRACR